MKKRLLIIVLCLLMLLPLAVSCGKDPNDHGPVIQMYLTSNICNFDPMYSFTDDANAKIMGLLYQGLFEMSTTGMVKKALCKDFEIVDDEENDVHKMVVTINETGWSDGRPVSVDDVIFAWKRVLDPENNCSAASLLFEIKNAREYNHGDVSPEDVGLYAVDSKVLEIAFNEKINYELFLENLCSPMLYPLREDVVNKAEEWASTVAIIVTNGPFAVKGFKVGSKLVLQRNSYYYRDEEDDEDESVTPYKIYIDLRMDPGEQLEAFDDGYLFLNSEIDLDSRESRKATSINLMSVHTYYFNTTKEPFNIPEVRKALSIALDREEMAAIAVYAEAADGLITPGVFNTSRKDSFRKVGGSVISKDGNIEEAKALLKTVTVSTKSFSIKVRNNPVDVALAEYAKDVWGELGFRVKVEPQKFKEDTTENQYPIVRDEFSVAFRDGDFDVAGVDLNMFSSDAFSTLAQFSPEFSGAYYDLANEDDWTIFKPGVTGWESEEYTALINEAFESGKDRAERARLLHEAEEMLLEECPVTPVVFLKNSFIISKKLSKVRYTFNGGFDFTKTTLKDYKKYAEADKQ